MNDFVEYLKISPFYIKILFNERNRSLHLIWFEQFHRYDLKKSNIIHFQNIHGIYRNINCLYLYNMCNYLLIKYYHRI